VIPRQFIASIDEGIQRAMHSGLAAGFPVVDIRVTVTDGRSHPVDSSDTAFALAGEFALRDAARSAGVTLLEPTDELRIITADEYVGALISDLTSRRSRVTGTQPIDGGQTLITAIAPTAELSRYAIDLRALTHGTASFDRERRGLEPVPATVAQRLQAQNGT
jgi:elongation factor G